MPDFNVENSLPTGTIIAGIDEAGRGPWAGPVVAATVIFKNLKIEPILAEQINDSKKLTPNKRQNLSKLLLNSNAYIGIGTASEKEIDQLNILKATFLAMHRALKNNPLTPDYAIVDGNQNPKLPCKTILLVKGDALSLSVAAASIIAKVYRDNIMNNLAKEYPQYGWDKNSGYGTKKHLLALEKYGVTPYHRKSYKPVLKILENIK